MKTSIQIVLFSLILLAGCGKDYDVSGPDQHSLVPMSSISTRSECQDLTTRFHLTAWAKLLSPKPSGDNKRSLQAASSGSVLSNYYIIEGSGDGWSDSLTRCLTSILLAYSPDTERFSGSLTSTFQNEEVLDQYIDGTAQVEKNGESLVFTLELSAASLRIADDLYYLEGGQILLTIPEKLSGRMQLIIETGGRYCAD